MKKKMLNRILGLIILVFAIVVGIDIMNNPTPADLTGIFHEQAFVRNEQNKGGIVRVYAFHVSDTSEADYQGCGDLMPHNEYGSTTTVYFFEKDSPTPEHLQLDPPHFDRTRYQPVAVYIKGEDGVGRISLKLP